MADFFLRSNFFRRWIFSHRHGLRPEIPRAGIYFLLLLVWISFRYCENHSTKNDYFLTKFFFCFLFQVCIFVVFFQKSKKIHFLRKCAKSNFDLILIFTQFGEKIYINFGQRSKVWSKPKFCWKTKFCRKIESLLENRNFAERIEILPKNRNLAKNSKFC